MQMRVYELALLSAGVMLLVMLAFAVFNEFFVLN
jgi:hypothetical protein